MTENNHMDFLWRQIKACAEEIISPISYETYVTKFEAVDIIGKKLVLQVNNELYAKAIGGTLADKMREAIVKANLGLNDFALVVEGKEGYFYNGPDDDITQDDYVPVPIDPKYTFDGFVVGKSNEFVFAAAQAVAKNPAGAYNPLFIYGSTGLGKTHLLQAVANYINQNKPSLKVLYTTSEKFTNELIDGILAGKSTQNRSKGVEFRSRYRNVDVLIIDDIQFLAKKPGCQEEFFHTFNELSSQNKQIILSSDKSPHEIQPLAERLRTRFDGGLTVDIQAPDMETKIAILKKKAYEKKCPVPDEVLHFLAENSGSDVRTLEGRLNKVIFASKLQEANISVELAGRAINQSVSEEENEEVTTDKIIKSVCDYYKIEKNDLLGKCKRKEVVTPRHIASYLICALMNLPLVTIGEALGGRDHTTVIHAREKITNAMKMNDKLAKEVNDIRNIILKQ